MVSKGKCEDTLSDGINGDKGNEGDNFSNYENQMVADQNMFDGCKVNILCY